jgi:hypothetical protein
VAEVTIEITNRTQGVWFVALKQGDWMATIEVPSDGGCKIVYRFRVYRDDKVWGSDDSTRWTEAITTDVPNGIQLVRKMADLLAQEPGANKPYELIRGTGTITQFVEQLGTLPVRAYEII